MRIPFNFLGSKSSVFMVNLSHVPGFTYQYLNQFQTAPAETVGDPVYVVERATLQPTLGCPLYSKYFGQDKYRVTAQSLERIVDTIDEEKTEIPAAVEELAVEPDTTVAVYSAKSSGIITQEFIDSAEIYKEDEGMDLTRNSVQGRGCDRSAEIEDALTVSKVTAQVTNDTCAEIVTQELLSSLEPMKTGESSKTSTEVTSTSSFTSTYVLAGEVVNGTYIPTAPSAVKFLPLYQLGVLSSGEVIGRGGFGEVSRVTTIGHGEGVIKRIGLTHASMAIREAEFLTMMCHPNIIKLAGCFHDKEAFVLFFKTYCPTKLRHVSHEMLKEVLIHIASAVEYIHRLGVVHRDIKPCNIMLNGEQQPKLIDFGLAKVLKQRMYTDCGTEGYMAPEIGRDCGYNESVDVYALAKTAENLYLFEGTEAFDARYANAAIRPSLAEFKEILMQHVPEEECEDTSTELSEYSSTSNFMQISRSRAD